MQKKNAVLLVLPIEEMRLGPDLSSPFRFRIQGGTLSMTYLELVVVLVVVVVVVAGQDFPYLILDSIISTHEVSNRQGFTSWDRVMYKERLY